MEKGIVTSYFVTGIGTDVGKTVAAAILVEALDAYYWKPIQAGGGINSDLNTVRKLTDMTSEKEIPEFYKLLMPASPHWAAREERKEISITLLKEKYIQIVDALERKHPAQKITLIIEGAGGLLVPLTNNRFVADFIKDINIPSILVSRHYLGSINHSLLTAAYCKQQNIKVAGWIFNAASTDDNDNAVSSAPEYAKEISHWSSLPILMEIPRLVTVTKEEVKKIAVEMSVVLKQQL